MAHTRTARDRDCLHAVRYGTVININRATAANAYLENCSRASTRDFQSDPRGADASEALICL